MATSIVSSRARLCLGARQKTRPTWWQILTRKVPALSQSTVSSRSLAYQCAVLSDELASIAHWITQARNRLALTYTSPLWDDDNRPAHTASAAEELPSPQSEISPTHHKVLLMGRPTPSRHQLKDWFEALRCHVYTACSSLEAVKCTPLTLCTLIVVDVETLIESAEQVIQLLHSHLVAASSHTKIVAISQYVDQFRPKLADAGAHYCFPKPLDKATMATLFLTESESGNDADSPSSFVPDSTDSKTSQHLLIVEDHFIQQEIMRMWCEKQGVTYQLAANVAEAKQAIQSARFDLILTDMGLPDGDGVMVIEEARQADASKNRDTYIIAVSANAEDFESKCREAGVNSMYRKPASEGDMSRWLQAAHDHAAKASH